jgi:N-acetylglucosaminyldiphosphoundecaprenol N-acetyl-beta-D-mannosaminyltransferase
MKDRFTLWNIPVDRVNQEQAISCMETFFEREGVDWIVTPNSEMLVNALSDTELKTIIQKASLVIPDGIGLVYASRIMKQPLTQRVTGIDFLEKALEWLEKHGKGVFLLGGKPGETNENHIANLAANEMTSQFPSLKIKGTHHGYFDSLEEDAIVRKIVDSQAEFLCVAMGSPKQEKFIYENRNRLGNVRCAIGVGGSLDIWAGTVKRAPGFYQNHGLEWLYRIGKEPTRLKRAIKLPVFMAKVIMTKGKTK